MKLYHAEKFNLLLSNMSHQLTSLENGLQQVDYSLKSLVETDFTGNGAEAIKYFYFNSHIPLIKYWRLSIKDGQNILNQIEQMSKSFDSASQAVVNQDFIDNEVSSQLQKHSMHISDITNEVNSLIRNISDIVSVPEITDENFQNRIQNAEKCIKDTVEELHELDLNSLNALERFEDAVLPIEKYISELAKSIEVGNIDSIYGLARVTMMTQMPEKIKSELQRNNNPFSILNPYSNMVDNFTSTTLTGVQNSFGYVPFNTLFGEIYAQRLFFASGYTDVLQYETPKEMVAGVSKGTAQYESDLENAKKQGDIIHEWGDGHIQATGGDIDIQALKDAGVRIQTFTTVSGKELNYTVNNGEFILFRDDPDLHYYTNGSVQTKTNQYTAIATMFVGGFIGYKATGSLARKEWKKHTTKEGKTFWEHVKKNGEIKDGQKSRTPKEKTIVVEEKKDDTIVEKALEFGKGALLGTVPIIGTEVPAAGSQEIIVWLSEDEGEKWSTKVHVKVSPGGTVTIKDYEDYGDDGFIAKTLKKIFKDG